MSKQIFCDYLIIGQGLCGSIVANMLMERDKNIIVMDPQPEVTSSRIAAGIVNPVTGKNFVKTWMADTVIPFARNFYIKLEHKYNVNLLFEKLIFRGLGDAGAENQWLSRTVDPDYADYCTEFTSFQEFAPFITPADSYGLVKGGFQLNLPLLLDVTTQRLKDKDAFRKEIFDYKRLNIDDDNHFHYEGISFGKVIFCEGFRGEQNPFFPDLPFSPSKGEVLYIKIPGATFRNLIKHNVFIAHIKDDIYWVGGGYEWRASDEMPSDMVRNKLETELKTMLKISYEILEHKAAIRPATRSRRPFIMRHPGYSNMYFFNGMGTKGTSLAPYFADRLLKHMEAQDPL